MVISFNLNEWVKVKLSERGVEILKQRHDELNKIIQAHGGEGLGELKPPITNDGYWQVQMWSIMETFGPYMDASMVSPFEDNIIHLSAWGNYE